MQLYGRFCCIISVNFSNSQGVACDCPASQLFPPPEGPNRAIQLFQTGRFCQYQDHVQVCLPQEVWSR